MRTKRLSRDDLTDEQRAVLEADGDLLVVGRPGTGKTSVALLKALKHLASSPDTDEQVLFLSFSRAAVQRIEAAAKLYVPRAASRRLFITTFHAFCFDILRSHARLAGMPRLLGIVLPHEERMITAEVTDRDAEYARLEREEGRIPFDRLIELTLRLFERHPELARAYARAYPLVLIDEYQDTNDTQDALIDLLAAPGQVIYLGDPEQRIYDWLPEVRHDRFERLIARRWPTRIDLPLTCHRSGASDLIAYGRAVLSGATLSTQPKDVLRLRYAKAKFSHQLRVGIRQAEKAVRAKLGASARPEVAIMSYKNSFVARLSSDLRGTTESFLHPFAHRLHVGLEEIGPMWAVVLALLGCRGDAPATTVVGDALHELGRHERAQGTKGRLKRAQALFQAAEAMRDGSKVKKPSLRGLPARVESAARAFTGQPRADVRAIIELLRQTPGGYFNDVIKVLDLRSPADASNALVGDLADAYASHGYYRDAARLGDAFLLREHLVRGEAGAGGRIVMTLHKCKGKEFDAVVIADGPSEADGLVLGDDDAQLSRSRRLLAMAIARARHNVVIVTPAYRPCPLLPEAR
ncbi:MAG: ATP-dependent helicase [Sandaracinaceae bacterium]|nr:ATP-dependent helicase [Sandaracinaceae bacterium]